MLHFKIMASFSLQNRILKVKEGNGNETLNC